MRHDNIPCEVCGEQVIRSTKQRTICRKCYNKKHDKQKSDYYYNILKPRKLLNESGVNK